MSATWQQPRGILRAGRMRTIALWASIAANLFFVALIGSHLALRPPPPPPGMNGFVRRLAASLPPADARRFQDAMTRERPWYAQAHDAMNRARQRFAAAVGREPYDEADARQRLHEFRSRMMEGSSRFGDSLIAAIRTLSPEGRKRLAAALMHRPHH